MTISMNHTIVLAKDKEASARFFADLFGLEVLPSSGRFAFVRVNDELTMDFEDAPEVAVSNHWAFKVSEAEFDAIFARIQAAGIPYGSGPFERTNMRINPDRRGGRSVYFEEINGHLLEIMTA